VATSIVVIGILVCAFQAMRSSRLLTAALWLAGTSALVACLMYLLGAPELAVIELSVGAGLVTILFVFAINIAGDQPVQVGALVPRPVSAALVIVALALLVWFNLPGLSAQAAAANTTPFTKVFWQERSLDTLLQLVLIFAGALGILGLLTEGNPHAKKEEGR